MPKTNWDNVDAMQAAAPHTFNALQHLVMAMAKFVKYRGKKSLFGRDRGLAAYKTFEVKLKDTVLALVLDGVITRDASAEEARLVLMDAIATFEAAFPNWQDAYQFAIEYFIGFARDRRGSNTGNNGITLVPASPDRGKKKRPIFPLCGCQLDCIVLVGSQSNWDYDINPDVGVVVEDFFTDIFSRKAGIDI